MPDFAARRRMMVDTQVRPADVTKYPIIEAMQRIPREHFVPSDLVEVAYVGENIPVGDRRVILEPRTLSKMLDALNLQPDDLVLDLGSAYGYSAAIVAALAQAVIALEEDEILATEAERALADQGVDNAAVIRGPLREGAAKHGPYDAILLQGAVEQIPEAILSQLKDGGRIAALFSEGALGVVRLGYKIDGKMNWRFDFNAGAPVLPGFEIEQSFAF